MSLTRLLCRRTSGNRDIVHRELTKFSHAGVDLDQLSAERNLHSGIIELRRDNCHLANGLLVTSDGYFLTPLHCVRETGQLEILDESATLFPVVKTCAIAPMQDIALAKAEIPCECRAVRYNFRSNLLFREGDLSFLLTRWDGRLVPRVGGNVRLVGNEKIRMRSGLYIEELYGFASVVLSSYPGDSGGAYVDSARRIIGFHSASGNGRASGPSITAGLELINFYARHLNDTRTINQAFCTDNQCEGYRVDLRNIDARFCGKCNSPVMIGQIVGEEKQMAGVLGLFSSFLTGGRKRRNARRREESRRAQRQLERDGAVSCVRGALINGDVRFLAPDKISGFDRDLLVYIQERPCYANDDGLRAGIQILLRTLTVPAIGSSVRVTNTDKRWGRRGSCCNLDAQYSTFRNAAFPVGSVGVVVDVLNRPDKEPTKLYGIERIEDAIAVRFQNSSGINWDRETDFYGAAYWREGRKEVGIYFPEELADANSDNARMRKSVEKKLRNVHDSRHIWG